MNPKSTSIQAAIIRDEAAKVSDPLRREAMERGADNLDKMAAAVPTMKAVLAIYDVFPDAELVEVRPMR